MPHSGIQVEAIKIIYTILQMDMQRLDASCNYAIGMHVLKENCIPQKVKLIGGSRGKMTAASTTGKRRKLCPLRYAILCNALQKPSIERRSWRTVAYKTSK